MQLAHLYSSRSVSMTILAHLASLWGHYKLNGRTPGQHDEVTFWSKKKKKVGNTGEKLVHEGMESASSHQQTKLHFLFSSVQIGESSCSLQLPSGKFNYMQIPLTVQGQWIVGLLFCGQDPMANMPKDSKGRWCHGQRTIVWRFPCYCCKWSGGSKKNIKQSFLLAAIAVVVGAISFHMQTPNTYMHTYIHTHLYVNPSHKTRYYSCFVFHSFFIRSYVLFYL